MVCVAGGPVGKGEVIVNPSDLTRDWRGSGSRRNRVMRTISLSLLALFLLATTAAAETVEVKYRGPVELTPFECVDVTRSRKVR